MSMVEPGNCWDAIPNGGEDELDNILNILDFPLESLEDDGFVADWDIGESQCLGPIPSNELMGSAAVAPHLSAGLLARNDGSQDQKQQFNLGSANCPHHSLKLNEAQESSTFHTQSPVSVLESSGSCSAYHKSLPPTSTMPIPMRARSRRPKQAGPNPWLSALSLFSTSKWASIPRKEKFKKMKKSLDEAERLRVPPSSDTTAKCTHCEVTKTPQWREGPLGPKTLCNACGVRYRSGRLFPEYRPAASPTFVSFLHSNSHKKVIEMRKRAKKLKVKTKERPTSSPQPEFIPMSNHLFDFIY